MYSFTYTFLFIHNSLARRTAGPAWAYATLRVADPVLFGALTRGDPEVGRHIRMVVKVQQGFGVTPWTPPRSWAGGVVDPHPLPQKRGGRDPAFDLSFLYVNANPVPTTFFPTKQGVYRLGWGYSKSSEPLRRARGAGPTVPGGGGRGPRPAPGGRQRGLGLRHPQVRPRPQLGDPPPSASGKLSSPGSFQGEWEVARGSCPTEANRSSHPP